MENEIKKLEEFKSLQLLHKAMLFGQILFLAIAFILNFTGKFSPASGNNDQVFQVIAVLLSFVGFFAGKYLFQKKILKSKESPCDLKTKLKLYRAAAILQWALLEGPSLFCIICFLLTGNYAFLALSATLVLLFTITGPNKLKIGILLHLSQQELDQL
jgi:hypothetical protein